MPFHFLVIRRVHFGRDKSPASECYEGEKDALIATEKNVYECLMSEPRDIHY